MSYTTLASWPLLIWKALEEGGHDPEPVFALAGIDPKQLSEAGSRVSEKRLERCWIEASRVAGAGEGCFGLAVARHWHPTTLHALGFACLASHTLMDAFERFVRFSAVVTDAAHFHIEPIRGGHHFCWNFADQSVSGPVEEQHASLATILDMAKLCVGGPLTPVAVHLAHAENSCSGALEAFFGCPIVFEQPRYGLSFSTSDFERRLPTANLELLSSSEKVVADYLSGLERGNVIARTRAEVMCQLPSGKITEESVAGALNMSLRTFQRRLRDNGTVYRELVDEVRRDLAGKYLANPRYSITEISYLLGFSEPSSFARSFRRWNGNSPSAVRQAL